MRAPSPRLRGEGRGEGARPQVHAWGKGGGGGGGGGGGAGGRRARLGAKRAPTSPRKRGEVEPAARLCINMSGICCSGGYPRCHAPYRPRILSPNAQWMSSAPKMKIGPTIA